MVKFKIDGEPVGKARHRYVRQGNGVRSYTPEKTVWYEELVKTSYLEQVKDQQMLEGPLNAKITAFFKIPKRTTKRDTLKMIKGEIIPTKKPDLDNIAKTVLDALNGVAFHDDKQIATLFVEKYYSDAPRVEVILVEKRL